jgi:hypothetical protein
LSVPANQVRLTLALMLIAIAAIGLSQLNFEKEEGPCGPSQYIGKCFLIESDICMTTYAQLEIECTNIIKTLSLAPGRLTQPIMKNCIEYKYSKMFTFLKTAAPFCDARREEVLTWGKSNPDF